MFQRTVTGSQPALLFILILAGADTAAFAAEEPDAVLERLMDGWDEDVGLWRSAWTKPGTQGVRHTIHANAARLLTAAMDGRLERVPTGRVLRALRQAQEKAGRHRGGFWWDWEDRRITDHNSGFFTTLPLLVLHHEFRDRLAEVDRPVLDSLLDEARHWFQHKVLPLSEDRLRYPNAYLGDTVCLWLLSEKAGEIAPDLVAAMPRILSYYKDHDWGWGEHLSDMYGKICQNELVVLLCYAKKLSPAERALAEELFRELATIDAAFAGGPRVPAIRNYWMEHSPGAADRLPAWFRPYAEHMRSWSDADRWEPYPNLAHRHRLHERLRAAPSAGPSVTVDCNGGVRALAWVDQRWRLGVMSCYPLAVDVNLPTHGLHWQSMPVAFWHSAGDWAYLQWLAEEDGQVRGLPAFSRATVKSHILSDRDKRAAVGQTFGYRHGRQFLALRRLPTVSSAWAWCGDRFRILNSTSRSATADRADGWHRLLLDYGRECLTVGFLPFGSQAEPRLTEDKGERHWTVRHELIEDQRPETIAGLWYLTVGDRPATPPSCIVVAGGQWRIRFDDGHTVTITPQGRFAANASSGAVLPASSVAH